MNGITDWFKDTFQSESAKREEEIQLRKLEQELTTKKTQQVLLILFGVGSLLLLFKKLKN